MFNTIFLTVSKLSLELSNKGLNSTISKLLTNFVSISLEVIYFTSLISNPFSTGVPVPLMNLGSKLHVKINLLENVIGDVYTRISSYGINTVLINLYIKFYLIESFLYPPISEIGRASCRERV